MNVLAICDRRYAKVAYRVAQQRPLNSPPRYDRSILWPNWEVADMVYIDLHGDPGEPDWLFADGERVLHISDVGDLPMDLVVFTTTCHLAQTSFYDVFRRGALVCGDGINYGLRDRAIGAPLLALWFRRWYERTWDVSRSLALARMRVALTAWRSADRDALQFRVAPPLPGAARS